MQFNHHDSRQAEKSLPTSVMLGRLRLDVHPEVTQSGRIGIKEGKRIERANSWKRREKEVTLLRKVKRRNKRIVLYGSLPFSTSLKIEQGNAEQSY